jgi:hypothetical protein
MAIHTIIRIIITMTTTQLQRSPITTTITIHTITSTTITRQQKSHTIITTNTITTIIRRQPLLTSLTITDISITPNIIIIIPLLLKAMIVMKVMLKNNINYSFRTQSIGF